MKESLEIVGMIKIRVKISANNWVKKLQNIYVAINKADASATCFIFVITLDNLLYY